MRNTSYFLIALVLSVFSCKKKKIATVDSLVEINFRSEPIRNAIDSLLKLPPGKDSMFFRFNDTLKVLYEKRKYNPYWLEGLFKSNLLSKLTRVIDSAKFEGLTPEYYNLQWVINSKNIIANLKGHQLEVLAAKTDLFISNLLLGIYHDKVFGRVDPKSLFQEFYALPRYRPDTFYLEKLLDTNHFENVILDYHCPHPDFNFLKHLLAEVLLTLPADTALPIELENGNKLDPGDTNTLIKSLAEKLNVLGFLNDSFLNNPKYTIYYSRPIVNAMKKFQAEHHLTNDGVVGQATIKMLNFGARKRVEEIEVNMERMRWFVPPEKTHYVRVNLPEFKVWMIYPADSSKSMNICVGKGKEKNYEEKWQRFTKSGKFADKPMNNETPQISSFISTVVLNPQWSVPNNIISKEMYPLFSKDPGYLVRNGYRVFKGDLEINPYAVNWLKYKPGNIPFSIRQDPGEENALGKIKFLFRNPFNIYMHDTPNKGAFKNVNRAVSHGCMRLEKPIDFGGFVLFNNKRYTHDKLLLEMGYPPIDSVLLEQYETDTVLQKLKVDETKIIYLEKPVPLFVDYQTIIKNEKGVATFVFDIYDKNKLILNAMRNSIKPRWIYTSSKK